MAKENQTVGMGTGGLFSAYDWKTSNWSACSAPCGGGVQVRIRPLVFPLQVAKSVGHKLQMHSRNPLADPRQQPEGIEREEVTVATKRGFIADSILSKGLYTLQTKCKSGSFCGLVS